MEAGNVEKCKISYGVKKDPSYMLHSAVVGLEAFGVQLGAFVSSQNC